MEGEHWNQDRKVLIRGRLNENHTAIAKQHDARAMFNEWELIMKYCIPDALLE